MPLAARLEYPVWEQALKSSGISDEDTKKIVEKIKAAYVKWDENAFPGMLANVVAGRIANRLNLGGINCVVDAACASSFAALKMAISELVEHRSDMMLTGGVDTDNSIMAYISFSKTPAVTPSDNVKPFDAKSDGMMLGEGIGMILLKRLEDAVRDGDKIYAVIKGIGTSSDGRYKSIYAPRKEGQVTALRRAYEDAGFPANTVGLIEAHGTGTMAGDPTEFSSLKAYFEESDSQKQHVALGSVKSQIGHTKAAAGAASLIKTALALHHKVLPATININEPNPKLDITNSAFYLNTETRPWIRPEGTPPRRAGISSFGFGGTNYHVVLEEYMGEQELAYRLTPTAAEVILFADTPAQLLSKCEQSLASLQSASTGSEYFAELTKVSKSVDIPTNAARVGFVAESINEACKFMQVAIDLLKNKPSAPSWEHPQGIYYRASGMELNGKVVALFSGQGSQYLEMGRELVMNFPALQRLYGYMDSLFIKDKLQPVSQVLFPSPGFNPTEKEKQTALLQQTEYAQPAIGMFSAGLYKILQQAGFKADFTAGHSFGELTALWAAGVLSDEDYCFLVKARGQAMAAPKDSNYDAGTMVAVKEDVKKVQEILQGFPHVTIANLNSPRQVVLAGTKAEISKIQPTLKEHGLATVALPVSAAFHTPLIAFAQKAFANAIKTVTFSNPKIPVYTNTTAKPYPSEPPVIQKILEAHLNNPVLFKQEIENIYGAGGYCFVEFGPRKILTNLVKEILGERPHIAIALNPGGQKDSDRSLREAFVQLRVVGLPLKNLDPYQITVEPNKTDKNSKLTYRINGANYKSEKTKQAFEKALLNGHKVQKTKEQGDKVTIEQGSNGKQAQLTSSSPHPQTSYSLLPTPSHSNGNGRNGKKTPVNPISQIGETFRETSPTSVSTTEKTEAKPKLTLETKPAPVPQADWESKMEVKTAQTPINETNRQTNYQQILQSLEYVLAQFQKSQSGNLQVHGTYLNHQIEYVKTFFLLMQQQNSLLQSTANSQEVANLKSAVMQSLERSMMQFHNQQGETLRIHEHYLQHQVEFTKNFIQLVQQEYAQILGESTDLPIVSATLAEPVKTESVEIPALETLNGVKYQPTPVIQNEVTVPKLETKTELKPEPVVEELQSPTPEVQNIQVVTKEPETELKPIQPTKIEQVIAPVAAPKATPSIEFPKLAENILAITSEKTGYPVEMLELDMDMEADLGIDSIKRVEIMGALQEMYPDLPKPDNMEDLGELRTIGQIVNYLLFKAQPSVSSPEQDVAPVIETKVETATAITEFVPATPDTITAVASPEIVADNSFTPVTQTNLDLPNNLANNDFPNLAESLLNITSEKTGYPVEMLELDMDMEADLGIDSIKRVEIMGALQDMYPNLPKPDNMEELAELRTIGQIVNYLQRLAGNEKKNSQHEFEVELDDVNNTVQRRPVQLQYLPEPDFWEFSLPSEHIALITDDGTLTTTKVAQSLKDLGWKIVVLNFPASLVPEKSPLPEGVNRVALSELSEEHLQNQLAAITTNYGSIGAFIHIHPVFQAINSEGVVYSPIEKAIVKYVFLMAKHLKKPLNDAANKGRSCFLTAVRLDGAFGMKPNNQVNFGAIGAGLFGLTKTLVWEWSKVFCRAIDLSPMLNPEQSANNIIAEIHDPNRYFTEVAYGSFGRVTLTTVLDKQGRQV